MEHRIAEERAEQADAYDTCRKTNTDGYGPNDTERPPRLRPASTSCGLDGAHSSTRVKAIRGSSKR